MVSLRFHTPVCNMATDFQLALIFKLPREVEYFGLSPSLNLALISIWLYENCTCTVHSLLLSSTKTL